MIDFYDMHREEIDEIAEHITNAISKYLTENLGYEWQDGAPAFSLPAKPNDRLTDADFDDILSSDYPMDELDSKIDIHATWDERNAFVENQFLDDFTEAFQALPEEAKGFWQMYTQFVTHEDPVVMTTMRDNYIELSNFTIDCEAIRQQILQQPVSISYELREEPFLLSSDAYEADADRTILLGIAGQQGKADAVEKAFLRMDRGKEPLSKDEQVLAYADALRTIREDFASPSYQFQTTMSIKEAIQIASKRLEQLPSERKGTILRVQADLLVQDLSRKSATPSICLHLEQPTFLSLHDVEQNVSYEKVMETPQKPLIKKASPSFLRKVQKMTEGKASSLSNEPVCVAR